MATGTYKMEELADLVTGKNPSPGLEMISFLCLHEGVCVCVAAREERGRKRGFNFS